MGLFAGTMASVTIVALTITGYVQAATNTSQFAYWLNPRAAVIQNTTVIEGGMLYTANYTDGKWGTAGSYSSPFGRLFYMSLCSSFNTSTDAIDSFLQPQKENTGTTAVWTGGALFATDYEWYTYG